MKRIPIQERNTKLFETKVIQRQEKRKDFAHKYDTGLQRLQLLKVAVGERHVWHGVLVVVGHSSRNEGARKADVDVGHTRRSNDAKSLASHLTCRCAACVQERVRAAWRSLMEPNENPKVEKEYFKKKKTGKE